MPFYTYHCTDCMNRFELQRGVNQRDDQADCPRCESLKVSRMMSMPSLYSRSGDGELRVISGGGCGGCTTTSCGGCSVNN